MASGKILIVEDERHNLIILERILTFQGYQVSSVSSGEEALALTNPALFEVAILDLNLGRGLSGMDVLAHFRKNSPDTIIILLTGNGTLETAVEALRLGAHDYLIKPARSQEIKDSIERGLQIRKERIEQRKREAIFNQLEKNMEESLFKLRGEELNGPTFKIQGTKGKTDKQAESSSARPDQSKAQQSELENEQRYLNWGVIQVDILRRQLTINGRPLNLSPTEYSLIIYLVSEAPRIVPPQELVLQIQGYAIDQEEASPVIRTHIYRLRNKIRAVEPDKEFIKTIRGVGYTIVK